MLESPLNLMLTCIIFNKNKGINLSEGEISLDELYLY